MKYAISVFGIAVFAVPVVAFLGKVLVEHTVGIERERFKSDLQREVAESLARLESQAREREFRRARMQERRIEVIAELHDAVVSVQMAIRPLIRMIEKRDSSEYLVKSQDEPNPATDDLMALIDVYGETLLRLADATARQKIWLPSQVAAGLVSVVVHARQVIRLLGSQALDYHEFNQRWAENYATAQRELAEVERSVDQSASALESEFRRLVDAVD